MHSIRGKKELAVLSRTVLATHTNISGALVTTTFWLDIKPIPLVDTHTAIHDQGQEPIA